MIRIELPAHLRTLAGVKGEVTLEVAGPVTLVKLRRMLPSGLRQRSHNPAKANMASRGATA